MSDPSAEAHRLADAVHVRYGPRGSAALREAWYALYVAALLGVTWGLAATRGLLLQIDVPAVTASFGHPLTWVALGMAFAVVVALVRRAGRIRGPVVPELPWVDLVATTSIDRALVLREPWRVTLLLCAGLAAITGAVVGLSGWVVGAWHPGWVLGAGVAGVVIGWSVAIVWLSGQASTHPVLGGWSMNGRHPRRSIPVDLLRQQSARSRLLHGAVLVGDLRVAQLSLRTARGTGRSLRLRSRGPVRTLVRRDLLGYHRSPGAVLSGVVLVAAGVSGLCWALSHPDLPVLLAVVSVPLTYLGCGVWCEGLRLQGDAAAAPALLGMPPRRQALVHLVAPLVLTLSVGLVSVSGWAVLGPSPVLVRATSVGGGVLVVLLLSVAGQLWSAFRGNVPFDLITLGGGPALTTIWYAVPLVVVTGAGGILTSSFARGQGWWVGLAELLLVALILRWGVRALDRQLDEHRS